MSVIAPGQLASPVVLPALVARIATYARSSHTVPFRISANNGVPRRRGCSAPQRTVGASARELSYSQPHTSGRGGRDSAQPVNHKQLLQSFWKARGVNDEALLARLVHAGLSGIEGSAGLGQVEYGADVSSWVVDAEGGTSKAWACSP